MSLIYVYNEILIKILEDKKLGGKEVNKIALVDFSEHLGSASSFGIPCGLLTCHLNVNKAIKVNGSIESQKWFWQGGLQDGYILNHLRSFFFTDWQGVYSRSLSLIEVNYFSEGFVFEFVQVQVFI